MEILGLEPPLGAWVDAKGVKIWQMPMSKALNFTSCQCLEGDGQTGCTLNDIRENYQY